MIPLIDFSGAFSPEIAARKAVAQEVRRAGRDRYSVATFFNPPFDYVFACAPTCAGLGPPPPCTFGEHIMEMMRRTKAG
jgi:isopenicillin N synthase-like dioxygenase